MEKDFVHIKEEELKDVVGGRELYTVEMCEFMMKKTAEEAFSYLRMRGVRKAKSDYYMDQWNQNHK